LILFIAVIAFSACSSKENTEGMHEKAEEKIQFTEEEKKEYRGKGKEIVGVTLKSLGKNLMKSLKEKGVAHATEFCNLKASPLVDSLQKTHNVLIRRATLKPRNPENMANAQEQAVINAYLEQMKAGNTALQPVVEMSGADTVSFYSPIKIPAAVCLKCHGTPGQETANSDYKKINALYPEDKAIGYKEGEFRGIWSIHFPVTEEKK